MHLLCISCTCGLSAEHQVLAVGLAFWPFHHLLHLFTWLGDEACVQVWRTTLLVCELGCPHCHQHGGLAFMSFFVSEQQDRLWQCQPWLSNQLHNQHTPMFVYRQYTGSLLDSVSSELGASSAIHNAIGVLAVCTAPWCIHDWSCCSVLCTRLFQLSFLAST